MTPFVSLEQQRHLLGKTHKELNAPIQEHLLSSLLEYELAKEALVRPASADSKHLRSQIESAIAILLEPKMGSPKLNLEDLLGLHRVISDSKEVYRRNLAQPLNPAHKPLDPSIILIALRRFFEWVQSPSFGEIHAFEQLTLSQIRLCEIQPFQEHSHLTISLFCLHILLREGYLMPLYRIEDLGEFSQALERGLMFATEDLVRFNAQACERSYVYALKNL
ncbi:MAG: hypothetical protein VYA53_09165 [Acidobacteriota bacterium]|nr:hypothetical protein [Acidobacteriota bacterium]